MFVDEVVLKVMAGAGGDGCTAFRYPIEILFLNLCGSSISHLFVA